MVTNSAKFDARLSRRLGEVKTRRRKHRHSNRGTIKFNFFCLCLRVFRPVRNYWTVRTIDQHPGQSVIKELMMLL